MRVLGIIGDCLTVNSSANLCHLAYIRALVHRGFEVELLCADEKYARNDESLKIPDGVNVIQYPQSFYERLAGLKRMKKQISGNENHGTQETSGGNGKIKRIIRSIYGVYGTYRGWHQHAKHFRSEKYYDFILSISCPYVSHLTALSLIRSQKIHYGKWIQIWEDPWYTDIANEMSGKEEVLRAERYLCQSAEDIIYVSPLTLENQKLLYPESAEKMRFVPPIAYYKDIGETPPFSSLSFGYFGDYEPSVRNLLPFYEAAKNENWRVFICGKSSSAFESSGQILVKPRIPLTELHIYEKQVNVLVFLCNRTGGQIPGKIYQYSASDKLILFILDGNSEEKKAIRRCFEKLERYFFCENNPEDIKRAVQEMLKCDKKEMAKPSAAFEEENILDEILKGEA